MKFDKNVIIEATETLIEALESNQKILEKCDAEIKMWRNKHILGIENYFLSLDEGERFKRWLLTEPAGIENIDSWSNDMLKCYRETQEKIK